MGTGIAIVANKVAGLNVKLIEPFEERLVSSRKFTEKWLEKEIQKKSITSEQRDSIL